ncbi:hypothetical protein [Streptomyces aurantiogriseus]|nr:hypothetical protein [Streptomyces aurantiogriseus]
MTSQAPGTRARIRQEYERLSAEFGDGRPALPHIALPASGRA